MPSGLVPLLARLGVSSTTTVSKGWRELGNGDLAREAYAAGFRVILTRDRLFGEAAGRALRDYPDLAVIILRLRQSRGQIYLKAFEQEWLVKPPRPVPGSIVEWPTSKSDPVK